MGEHHLVATLSDANHCDLPVTSPTLVVGDGATGDAMPGDAVTDDHVDASDHDADAAADDHDHEAEGVDISLGVLEVHPR